MHGVVSHISRTCTLHDDMKIRITRMVTYSSMHAVTYTFTYCSLFLSSSALFSCFSNFFTNWTTKHDNYTQLNLHLYQAWSLCLYVPYNVENIVCDLGLVSDIPWSLYKNKNDNKRWVQFILIYIKQLSCPCTIILHITQHSRPPIPLMLQAMNWHGLTHNFFHHLYVSLMWKDIATSFSYILQQQKSRPRPDNEMKLTHKLCYNVHSLGALWVR